jgi:hypothetical protein
MHTKRNGQMSWLGSRLAWMLAGGLAVLLGCWGVVAPDVYDRLIAPGTRPGALSQDVISVVAGVALCGLALRRRTTRPKEGLVALGLLGYLFYGYGIYVIERVYNVLYLGYLALFATAFWSLAFGAMSAGRSLGPGAHLDRRTRRWSAAGSVLQPLIFYPLWISMLIPLLARRDQIDSLYSIFILDLCFIMPAFLIVAVGTVTDRGAALVLAPVMFVLGAALILSLALGELVKPFFGAKVTLSGLLPPVALTVLFAVLGALHLTRLRLQPAPAVARRPGANETR